MTDPCIPFHAHIYYSPEQRPIATVLRDALGGLTGAGSDPKILFVGHMTDGPAGPHPIAQYEVHFHGAAHAGVEAMITASGLRALIHPLTDDDLADHTSLAQWIGDPVTLDVSVLDPLGQNQGVPRFGLRDF